MIKLNEFLSLSEEKAVSGTILIDWTKTVERLKTLHRKQSCLDCDNGKTCSEFVTRP